jgi:hypothetical protein
VTDSENLDAPAPYLSHNLVWQCRPIWLHLRVGGDTTSYILLPIMASLECAKAVTIITSSLYQIQLIIEYLVRRREGEPPAESRRAELQLLQSTKDAPRRINTEYNQALRVIGSAFSNGDGMTLLAPKKDSVTFYC